MNTQLPPKAQPETATHVARRTRAVAVLMAVSGLIAVLLIAALVIWRNQYLPVVYNAAETSTTPYFAPGFLAMGFLEAVGLVLAATIALVAGLIVRTGESAYRAGLAAQLFRVTAAALVAVAIPVGILYAFVAFIPLFLAAIAAAVAAAVGGGGTSSPSNRRV